MRTERGAVLMMVAVILPVMLMLGALVVDMGAREVAQTQAQMAADAGALAAALECQQGWDYPEDAARRLVEANGARLLAFEAEGCEEHQGRTVVLVGITVARLFLGSSEVRARAVASFSEDDGLRLVE